VRVGERVSLGERARRRARKAYRRHREYRALPPLNHPGVFETFPSGMRRATPALVHEKRVAVSPRPRPILRPSSTRETTRDQAIGRDEHGAPRPSDGHRPVLATSLPDVHHGGVPRSANPKRGVNHAQRAIYAAVTRANEARCSIRANTTSIRRRSRRSVTEIATTTPDRGDRVGCRHRTRCTEYPVALLIASTCDHHSRQMRGF